MPVLEEIALVAAPKDDQVFSTHQGIRVLLTGCWYRSTLNDGVEAGPVEVLEAVNDRWLSGVQTESAPDIE